MSFRNFKTLFTLVSVFLFAFAGKSATMEEDGDTCLKKKFSVVFYAIQDSANTLTQASVNFSATSIINSLNNSFSPICVSFANCSTVIIPHHPFNSWEKSVDMTVTGNWHTEKTINIYIVDTVNYLPAYETSGYAHTFSIQGTHFSSVPQKDVIVLSRVSSTYLQFPGTPEHAMGHIFGLMDTYAEISIPAPIGSMELVNGTNCGINGDGICDTPADPFPLTISKDMNGDFFTRPRDNFMSMYNARCRFTPQQFEKMVKYILRHKMYLH